jgi:NADPH:quinone reductase-like Zn-dependent oxidoreductase
MMHKDILMKAIVYEKFGPPEVLHLAEVEKPTPQDDEVLVRVYATTVNYGDLLGRNFSHTSPGEFHMPFLFWLLARFDFGLREPKKQSLGSEFAGEIEATGKDVTRFKPGDRVFGYPGQRMGAYAEYLCLPADGALALMPDNLSYEEAAVVPYGAITALSLLRKVNLQPGQKVLINGASGGIGSAAVQLARYYGAEVTGVCGTPRVAFVKSLGADRVIDYTQQDFTQNGETYDLIFDILGKSSFSRCKNSLKEDGIYLLASFKLRQLAQMLWTSLTGRRKVVCALSTDSPRDLDFIKELVEAGQFQALVDRCFPLEQAAQAHRYAESGQKAGPVVISLDPSGNCEPSIAERTARDTDQALSPVAEMALD